MLWRMLVVVCMVIQIDLVMTSIAPNMNMMGQSGVVRGRMAVMARMVPTLRLHQTKVKNEINCKVYVQVSCSMSSLLAEKVH